MQGPRDPHWLAWQHGGGGGGGRRRRGTTPRPRRLQPLQKRLVVLVVQVIVRIAPPCGGAPRLIRRCGPTGQQFLVGLLPSITSGTACGMCLCCLLQTRGTTSKVDRKGSSTF